MALVIGTQTHLRRTDANRVTPAPRSKVLPKRIILGGPG